MIVYKEKGCPDAQGRAASTAVDLRDLFLLQPDVVYLNHGSCGACPHPVFETYQAWQLELERQPMAFMRQLGEAMREALARVVRLYEAWGKPREAAGWRSKSAQLDRNKRVPEDPPEELAPGG